MQKPHTRSNIPFLEEARLGKRGGHSDLEYALAFAWVGCSATPSILTTVHSLQVIEQEITREVHDIPVDYVPTL